MEAIMKKLKLMIFLLLNICMPVSFTDSMMDCNKLQHLLQRLVDNKQLDGYWHVDVFPERIPLRIVLPKKHLNKTLKLSKFSHDVILIENSDEQQNFIIEEVNFDKKDAYIKFSYPPEGIKGKVQYIKESNAWIETNFTLIEK